MAGRNPRKHQERRRRYRMRRIAPPGTPPGTVSVDPEAHRSEVTVLAYRADELVEHRIQQVEEIEEFLERYPVTWINVDGLGDAAWMEALKKSFDLHRLSIEDVVNVHQRPKVEVYQRYIYFVAWMVSRRQRIETEQVSLFLGPNWVLTFQEHVGSDSFDPVRRWVRAADSRVRRSGADYLAYSLIDAIIDAYFPVLETYGEQIDDLEVDVLVKPEPSMMGRIIELKKDLLTLRRAVWPLREEVNSLTRAPTTFIAEDTRYYLRDCYDHAILVLDTVDTYRELGTALMDAYLSSLSNRMNQVMQVLTVIATIFIPLTFISSIYGMNFNTAISPYNMPELNWTWGYPVCLGFMGAAALAMLFFFWRLGWLRVGRFA